MTTTTTTINRPLGYVKKIHDRMNEHQYMLCYRGSFSHDMIKSILSITEKKMNAEETETSVKKKVFNVMMECLQNICKGDEYSKLVSNALFMLGKNNTEYIIYSGNVIDNERAEMLKEKLKSLNGLNREELKAMYMTLISTASHIDNIGIALGLIDIAKKTGNKIDFSFKPIDDKYSFFSLNTAISKI
jgi:hypothetical protein